LKTLLVGAEEYETYDEEISNIFFSNVIQKEFHKQIFYFVSESQKFQLGLGKLSDYLSIFQSENEGILLNLLEILMVLNDVKYIIILTINLKFSPDSFKELINFEMEHSLLINLLFTEKSKYVRKVVETLFSLMSNSKSIESLNKIDHFDIKIKDKNTDIVVKSVKEALMIHVVRTFI